MFVFLRSLLSIHAWTATCVLTCYTNFVLSTGQTNAFWFCHLASAHIVSLVKTSMTTLSWLGSVHLLDWISCLPMLRNHQSTVLRLSLVGPQSVLERPGYKAFCLPPTSRAFSRH